jgi:hypothetical protein
MTSSLTLTQELFNKLQPTGRVYSPHSLASQHGSKFTWSNPDDQFVIELDLTTKTLTGHYYDWNEETEQWDDEHDVPMTAADLLSVIETNNLVLVTSRALRAV